MPGVVLVVLDMQTAVSGFPFGWRVKILSHTSIPCGNGCREKKKNRTVDLGAQAALNGPGGSFFFRTSILQICVTEELPWRIHTPAASYVTDHCDTYSTHTRRLFKPTPTRRKKNRTRRPL